MVSSMGRCLPTEKHSKTELRQMQLWEKQSEKEFEFPSDYPLVFLWEKELETNYHGRADSYFLSQMREPIRVYPQKHCRYHNCQVQQHSVEIRVLVSRKHQQVSCHTNNLGLRIQVPMHQQIFHQMHNSLPLRRNKNCYRRHCGTNHTS